MVEAALPTATKRALKMQIVILADWIRCLSLQVTVITSQFVQGCRQSNKVIQFKKEAGVTGSVFDVCITVFP